MRFQKIRLRLCAVLLCICLIGPACLTVQADEPLITVSYNLFSDVPASAWYRSAVSFACQNGLLVGVDKTHFAPQLEMSRAMLVSVLWRSCGEPEGFENTFSDVPEDSWYTKAVAWAAGNEIVSGTGAGRFSPNAPLTREQFAAMLYRFSSYLKKDISQTDDLSQFPDTDMVSDWAKSAMQWAVGAELIAGMESEGVSRLAPRETTTRAQAAAILARFFREDYPAELPVETLTYGTSGSGSYPLTAYRIGSGENILLLTYAIHGWEDNFNRDGQELVYLAECVLQTLKENGALLTQGDWTVYILPCLNPDGLYLGTTCNGKGRCTTTRLDEDGNLLSDKGIDMNRCFPYHFSPLETERSFNGTAPLQCREAIALSDFVQSLPANGYRLCIDTHGWFNQVIAKNKGGSIETAFYTQFPSSGTGNLANGSGYFSSWAAYELGFDACLFELPADVYSHTDFIASGYIQRYERAILTILASYTPKSGTRAAALLGELNGN